MDDGTLHYTSENRELLLRQFAAELSATENAFWPYGVELLVAPQLTLAECAKARSHMVQASREGPILGRIKELSSKGRGYAPIANEPNAAGIKPRRAKQRYPTTIANILGERERLRARQRARTR
jgi:hypothetical protein